jgi:hypothetical protein
VGHDHVQRVCRSSLEDADEDLALSRLTQLAGEYRALQKTRIESDGDQRESTGFQKDAALHVAVSYRR